MLYCHYDYILIMIGIFWVVNFKTWNYFVIFYYTERLLRSGQVRSGHVRLL
jgi:hypothetical protein